MKFRKYMVILILTGIFLCGLGTGIGFVEFSDLEYQGTVVLGKEDTAEKTLVWELGKEDYHALNLRVMEAIDGIEVVEDRKVPRDEIQIVVTYNQGFGEPYLQETEDYEQLNGTKTEKVGLAHLWFADDRATAIRFLMQSRDQILSDLKEKKFSTYELNRIYQVKVHVNPVNRAKLQNL